MRILLIATNRYRLLASAPIGALAIADQLRRGGDEVALLDLMHARDPAAELTRALGRHRPELIGLSIRNRDNQSFGDDYHDPLPDLHEIMQTLRAHSDAPVLIGGTAVTTFPTQMLRETGADYGFAGDDPVLVQGLVDSLAAGRLDTEVPGLVWREHGTVRANPAQLSEALAQRFSGHENLDLRAYRRRGYYDCGVLTHAGCNRGCMFCDAHVTFGRHPRLRDPAAVCDEMSALVRNHGARSLWLVNTGLNHPLDHAKELCARIAEARPGAGYACIIEPGDDIDAELARQMRRSGCQLAMIFATTLDDTVLERNAMPYRRHHIERTAQLLDEAGITYMLGLMFGLPGETLDGVEQSLDQGHRLGAVYQQTGVGFRIQPHTPLRDIAVAEGQLAADDDCFTPTFYSAREAPDKGVRARIRAHERAHPLRKLRYATMFARMARDGLLGLYSRGH
jgi:radical SAM superfamily enzyme YgiQ (UPF0313 family)